ncbi:DUF1772 domain-containing protein [Bradyrhizobium sp. AUGA SZCCT0182]|uniref:anthrone oxygenase family protein n=1 Tax=Bradyrhizobium sp. AUGA SZCCT0182 TaxID=2807667 RepID=UPI001BA65F83|nr:anthrone oxygenase family protein [Bradyrhizobium sp. AUGA SZCCT0182]MBR1232884.1 DUF1772 domain-containing protein [Bradyrhizobium sp. AUGA SZCCT0182]
MNVINAVIVQSLFIPLFLGATVASLLLAVAGGLRWGEPGATAMLAGCVLYVIGMFVCTAVVDVPLSNALATVDPASTEAAPLRARSLPDWTLWNHVRTIASTVACALFVGAIAVRSGDAAFIRPLEVVNSLELRHGWRHIVGNRH